MGRWRTRNCWFCGGAFDETRMGHLTREHLVPRSEGGQNRGSNVVSAHAACNLLAGRWPLFIKVRLRGWLRSQPDAGGSGPPRAASELVEGRGLPFRRLRLRAELSVRNLGPDAARLLQSLQGHRDLRRHGRKLARKRPSAYSRQQFKVALAELATWREGPPPVAVVLDEQQRRQR